MWGAGNQAEGIPNPLHPLSERERGRSSRGVNWEGTGGGVETGRMTVQTARKWEWEQKAWTDMFVFARVVPYLVIAD